MQGDLSKLIERVEKCSGPDRQLDALIFRALDLKLPDQFLSLGIKLSWQADGSATVPVGGDMQVRYDPPRFTSSLEAALALVEEKLPGAEWCRDFDGSFTLRGRPPGHEALANDALTCIAALLRALSSGSKEGAA